MYGPEYPLQSTKYLKCRVIPKLLDEKSEMFRFHSCKFNVERSKLGAARVVFFQEFGVTNCFTLEASMHAYVNKDRQTIEFTENDLIILGVQMGQSIHQY
jgi:hypothetical protein